jgi:FkbM family methyltransferase
MNVASLKNFTRQSLRRLGLHLFTEGSLPRGVDVYADLRRLPGGFLVQTVFDVGANIGQTSRSLSEVYPSAQIFAFEPFKSTFEKLQENTRHLPTVQAYQVALGRKEESLLIKGDPGSVFNSLRTEDKVEKPSSLAETIHVRSLDAFCLEKGVGTIDLLKTDTEGYDLEVLAGADEKLRSGQIRAVYCEIAFDPRNKQNTQFFPVYEFLVSRGFRFYGLYDTYFFHIHPPEKAFCDALFIHSTLGC